MKERRPDQPGKHHWVENSFLCPGDLKKKKKVMKGSDKRLGTDLEKFVSLGTGIIYMQPQCNANCIA